MADQNLTIQFAADTSKMRTQLELLKADMRRFGAEMRAARMTGDEAAVNRWATAYENVTRQVTNLNRQIKITEREMNATATAGVAHAGRLAKAFSNLETAIGIVRAGIGGFVVGQVFQEAIGWVDEYNKKLLLLNRDAQGAGLDPAIIKQFRTEVEKAGGDADQAVRGLMQFNRTVNDARVEARNSGEAIQGAVNVLRGSGEAGKEAASGFETFRSAAGGAAQSVQVFRGAQKIITDLNEPLKSAGVNAGRYTEAQIKAGAALRDFLARTQDMREHGRAAEADALAYREFGKNVEELLITYKPLLKILDEFAAKQAKGTAPTLQPQIDAAKKYQEQLVELSKTSGANLFADLATQLATTFMTNLNDTNRRWNAWATNTFLPSVKATWTSAWDSFSAAAEPALRKVGRMSMDLASSIGTALSGAFAPSPVAEAAIPGAAGAPAAPAQMSLGGSIMASIGKLIADLPQTMATFNSEWLKALATTQKNSDGVFLQISKSISETMGKPTIWDKFISAAKSAFDTVKGIVSSVGDAISSAVSNASRLPTVLRGGQSTSGQQSGPPPPEEQGGVRVLRGYAPGGLIHGPGTGTSDSILARLSTGEFVINAAATSRFLPLLRMINDGMRAPLVPRTSFASGGLVMATDAYGTPVHLHFDGHEFPLRTDATVAESLMRTARAKQMLSAGRKPSWAGGRRYGG